LILMVVEDSNSFPNSFAFSVLSMNVALILSVST